MEAAVVAVATAAAIEALVVKEATVAEVVVVVTVGVQGQDLAVTDGEEGIKLELGS